ncbi:uncharacterized protein EAE97_011574 [Botrytis byssoidea]|uniref:NACHT domain-containing protein n=1 Tax=Botrytis byssoidea TaxID=139641 RepID=A0A9P5I159_9HELO|nr:uncharacterized protein EAE97_011574 [Botrytis byssoidea]KAF7920233.1 hypothetical protein EAE97_011574 [Botrytis byssoidea]
MDPVSAISLAAAIAQFIDYSCKIVCKSKEIYSSTSGLTTEHDRTETATLRLKELAQSIRLPPKRTNSGSSIVHSRLQIITQECFLVSDTLINQLNQLKAPARSQHPKWKSFRMALKSVWSKDDIDEFALRLRDLRKELDTELLLLLRDGSDSMSSAAENHFQKLDENTKKVLNELLKMQSSDQEFLRRFERLSFSQQSEFQKLGLLTAKQNSSFESLNKDTKDIIDLLLESRVYCNENLILSRQLVEQNRQAAAELVERDSRQRVRRAQKFKIVILESLRFSDMNHRQDMIASPYQNSFHWIFRDSTVHQKPWSNFATWLSECSGIYWIQGKPASGKSTLMRFIYEHLQTELLLRKWAGSSKIITSAFYFWLSGTERQRSQIGLLRALLHGLLREDENLILEIFHEEWVRMCDLESHDLEFQIDEWSLGRLQQAFKRLVGMSSPSLKVCIFVDGLDEYEGDHGDMAEYLFDLANEFPFTKFCISSRPLPDFLSVFQDACTLKLEDLTRDDINDYVVAKLEQNQLMRMFISNDLGTTSWLIEEIIHRAQGVFLWVILVVKSLIHGFRCGDGGIELRKRLESLPVDLENLFSHIIQGIEPEFRQDASKIFQIFRTCGNNLDSITLHNALQYTSHHPIISMEAATESESMEERLMKINKTRLRLASRCRGLIEIADEHDGEMIIRIASNESGVRDNKQIFNTYDSDVNIVEEFRNHIQISAKNFFPAPSGTLASEPRAARQLAREIEDPRIDSAGNLIRVAVVVDPTLQVPLWLERTTEKVAAMNACYSLVYGREGDLRIRLSNDQMSALLGSIRSRACRKFVETHTRARCYMRKIRYRVDVERFQKEFRAKMITLEDVIHPYALWLHVQWGGNLSDWYHTIRTEQLSSVQESSSVEEESSLHSSSILKLQDFGAKGRIVYLHRTAVDFLERSRNWDEITKHTIDTTFDPELALLMARVIDIKLDPKDCVYTSGVELLSQLREIPWQNPKVMEEALELVQEADRVLSMQADRRLSRHWSQKDPKWAGRNRPDWGDDLDSAAVKYGLIMLLKARKSLTSVARYTSQPQLPLPHISVKTRTGLPLLAYALSMDGWALGDLVPDIVVLEELLIHGADPNEHVNSFYTIWEYVIYLVHVLVSKDNSEISSLSMKWVRVFELMLEHGANPYACCMKNSDEFAKFIGGLPNAIPNLLRSIAEHDQRGFSFGHSTKGRHDDEVWDENDTYPYHHCVSAVIKDVFEHGNVPGHQNLQEMIRIRMEK